MRSSGARRATQGIPQIEAGGGGFQLAGVEGIEQQDGFDQVQQLLRVCLHAVERSALIVRQGGVQLLREDDVVPDDGAQRCAQLVRNVGQEVILNVSRAQRCAAMVDGAPHEIRDLCHVEGLGDVIEDAMAEALNGGVERRVPGDHDHLDVRIEPLDVLHHLHTRHPGHAQIERDDVDRCRADNLERLLAARGGIHVVVWLEDEAQRFRRTAFVIDDQQGRTLFLLY
jgi:hypothetical protein